MPLLPAMLLQAPAGEGAEGAISIPLHQGTLMLPLHVNIRVDHKKLFKDLVGKLVKKVKTLEVKLKTKKRKLVFFTNSTASPSIPTTGPLGTSSVPPALFVVPPGPFDVPTAALTIPAGSLTVPTNVSSRADPTGVISKGKSLMVEEDIPVRARIFKQMEEDRLGEEAAKRLHDEEMAKMERERAEVQRKRQQEVLDSAMYYNESNCVKAT
nr:sm-like protein LSM7 [Tanacetum cinerariifolium]